jgi:CubicO group peptidase (beta-lactamase class C family)
MPSTHAAPSPLAALIQRHIDAGGFLGAALLVARNGRVVLEHYAGQARPGSSSSPHTLWPIASISKVYTATLIMRLVELGELTLNTHVARVLPRFTGEGREEIRLRHLLTHTSGMIYESPEMEARLAAQVPLDALIEEAYSAPLLFRAGTTVSYGDYNYLLAGHMAAVAMGQPYAALVRELVIAPMGLRDTALPPAPADNERIALVRGVMAEGTAGAMYNSPHARSLAHPAFGVVASAPDLLRFALHWAPGGPRLLSPAATRAMTMDQTGGVPGQHPSLRGIGSDLPIPWGYGWALQTARVPALFSELASSATFGHGGASGCQLVVDPLADLALVVLTNTHLRTGRDAWSARLQSIINCCWAQFGANAPAQL